MKKIIFSLFITFTLLILSNVESIGQCPSCPSPYVSASFQFTLPNGCGPITVNYCRDCSPTGHPIVKLCSVEIPYYITQCQNLQLGYSFWDEVKRQTLLNMYVYCINLEILPCPQRTVVEFYNTNCMTVEADITSQFWNLVPCEQDAGICMQEWTLCWDYNQPGEGKLVLERNGSAVIIEEGSCGFTEPILNSQTFSYPCFNICN